MSKPIIEHPRVFISYAWGDDSYQKKVLSFAHELVSCGIDVELDQWSLKEGHDKYAYMEQSVTDPTISNVLILLNKKYAEKADDRSGGVGTETQIISAEVYNKVKQEKFLPIIFERGADGQVFKPAYLAGVLHFDLSKQDSYENEFHRLVKRLYGIEVIKKPSLGSPPLWLEKEDVSPVKQLLFSESWDSVPDYSKSDLLISYLEEVESKLQSMEDSIQDYEDNYVEIYNHILPLRDQFLEIITHISSVEDGDFLFLDTLSHIKNIYAKKYSAFSNVIQCLVHELFIYAIAYLFKKRKYSLVARILNRTYFSFGYQADQCINTYQFFFHHSNEMDNAVCQMEDKQYYSGTAQYWMENINIDICSKTDFVFADILCYNTSVLGKNYHDTWYWFPLTYVYCNHDLLSYFATELQSRDRLSRIVKLFGYDSSQDFIAAAKEKDNIFLRKELSKYRFPSNFESAPFLLDYLKADQLGSCD